MSKKICAENQNKIQKLRQKIPQAVSKNALLRKKQLSKEPNKGCEYIA